MLQPIIEKSYLVEVPLGTIATGKQINFQFVPQLQGSFIYGVQVFSNVELFTSPNGLATISPAGCSQITVTFVVGDDQDLYQVPIFDLISQRAAGFVRMLNNKQLNLTKSYITINGTANLNNNEVAIFQFIYRNKK
jgi:hypothetical protein